jgi:hypothetical protein
MEDQISQIFRRSFGQFGRDAKSIAAASDRVIQHFSKENWYMAGERPPLTNA